MIDKNKIIINILSFKKTKTIKLTKLNLLNKNASSEFLNRPGKKIRYAHGNRQNSGAHPGDSDLEPKTWSPASKP